MQEQRSPHTDSEFWDCPHKDEILFIFILTEESTAALWVWLLNTNLVQEWTVPEGLVLKFKLNPKLIIEA